MTVGPRESKLQIFVNISLKKNKTLLIRKENLFFILFKNFLFIYFK